MAMKSGYKDLYGSSALPVMSKSKKKKAKVKVKLRKKK